MKKKEKIKRRRERDTEGHRGKKKKQGRPSTGQPRGRPKLAEQDFPEKSGKKGPPSFLLTDVAAEKRYLKRAIVKLDRSRALQFRSLVPYQKASPDRTPTTDWKEKAFYPPHPNPFKTRVGRPNPFTGREKALFTTSLV